MGKLIWCSDIHLNFVGGGKSVCAEALTEFYTALRETEGDAVLITGDIAESHNIVDTLKQMEQTVGKPIYFVLGNHDFYGSSVAAVRKSVKNIGADIHYIPAKAIELSASTTLIGVDAWGDCRNGDYERSRITMSDWLYIKDLNQGYIHGMQPLKEAIQKLADADARALARQIRAALKVQTGCKNCQETGHMGHCAGLGKYVVCTECNGTGKIKRYNNIIIATHVPPFKEACMYAGRKSTSDGLCFWSSQILGTTIKPIVQKHPDVNFTWLCGHTHSGVKFQAGVNLVVKVAQAEYYYPEMAEVIEYV